MSERRVLTEDEAFRLLAHFYATAELHLLERPQYADRRILEGTLQLVDALLRDADPEGRVWLETLKAGTERALAVRGRDRDDYEAYLHEAPGLIARELKRRRAVT